MTNFQQEENPLIAPEGSSRCACVNISPAGKLHHGGERPCARPQRQETQTHIRYGLNGQLDIYARLCVSKISPGSLLVQLFKVDSVGLVGNDAAPQSPTTVSAARSAQ